MGKAEAQISEEDLAQLLDSLVDTKKVLPRVQEIMEWLHDSRKRYRISCLEDFGLTNYSEIALKNLDKAEMEPLCF